MSADIIVFAVIAVFLIHRLFSVLGTKNGAERDRGNPFAPRDAGVKRDGGVVIDLSPKGAQGVTQLPLLDIASYVSAEDNKDGRIDTGLSEIAGADHGFELSSFMSGARAAFEMVVSAYAKGDLESLKHLLSPKLYADFSAAVRQREQAGYVQELTLHRIKAARIVEAHLGGVMAYITVDFDVEETVVTKDRDGNIINGNPDDILGMRDIWTFTRDTRSEDPNWTLIETRTP